MFGPDAVRGFCSVSGGLAMPNPMRYRRVYGECRLWRRLGVRGGMRGRRLFGGGELRVGVTLRRALLRERLLLESGCMRGQGIL